MHKLVEQRQMSVRRACKLIKLSGSVLRYLHRRQLDHATMDRLRALATKHPRWGMRKMHAKLRMEGLLINRKRTRRLYRILGLHLRRKMKHRLPARVKEPMVLPIAPNITWSMDFMHDTLANGRKYRTFNIIDDHNREALDITVDTSISSHRVVRQLEQLVQWRGKPERIRVDNGPEFIAQALELWCKERGIELHFIRKGKPTENGLIERFNRTYREEVLDANLFETLQQVRAETNRWIWEYNNERPHESLGNIPPRAFLLKRGQLPNAQIHAADLPTFQQDDHNTTNDSISFTKDRA